MAYQLVQEEAGNLATILTDDLLTTAKNLGLTITGVERRSNLRPCLQGQPKLAGYVGPSYGGEVNGVPVIRYESTSFHNGMN
jgi:hypothetical protein